MQKKEVYFYFAVTELFCIESPFEQREERKETVEGKRQGRRKR